MSPFLVSELTSLVLYFEITFLVSELTSLEGDIYDVALINVLYKKYKSLIVVWSI
jgi:hypothetical protein